MSLFVVALRDGNSTQEVRLETGAVLSTAHSLEFESFRFGLVFEQAFRLIERESS